LPGRGSSIVPQPALPFLTASLIVKNEERVLGDCLASIAPVVDEIVIVDTGSTDRSREIAKSHGARIIDFPWTGEFAAARNAGLDASRGRWILYIDADERLAPTTREQVRSMLAADDLVAARLWLRPVTGFTIYREYRLFLNHPEIRFQGIIHEKVTPDIRRLAETRGLRVALVDLFLDHVGYDGPQEHKHRRNLPLLLAELARDSENAYNWHHLGRVHEGLGDRAAALKAWQRALEVMRRRSSPMAWDFMIYVELIRAPETDRTEARRLLDEAGSLFPGNPLLRYWGGILDNDAGNVAAALEAFHDLARVDADAFRHDLTALDKRLFGEFSYAALGACYFRLGRFADSRDWYARAAACDPKSVEYRAKAQLAAAKAGQLVGPAGIS
jgi:glycosyltransferase involved in cell wall biosynthesis